MLSFGRLRPLLAVWLPLALFVSLAKVSAMEAFLIKDGEALGRIHSPPDAGRASRFAVEELKTHLAAITGATMETAWRDRLPNESGIVLQVRDRREWAGRESAQAFSIMQDVRPPVVTIEGNSHLAVLYGVYAYLESIGVRWYSPGDIGANIPRQASIAITPGETRSEPVFLLRSLDLSGTLPSHFSGTHEALRDGLYDDYALWLLRNRLHFRRHIHRERNNWFAFNRPPYGGGHALRRVAGLNRLFDDQEPASFETNPERWPKLTRDFVKARVNTGPHQICFTNEDNIRDAIANAARLHKEIEAAGNELAELASVSLSLADCTGICECDDCDQVAGQEPNRKDRLVWSFMNRVAAGLDARLPGRKISLYAPYFELTQPPPDVAIEPNIIAISCRSYSWDGPAGQAEDDPFPPRYREWIANTRKAGAEQAAYDYVLMAFAPQPLDILDALAEYRSMGYRYYHPEVMQRSEQTWPILWALAQASWDGSKNPRELFSVYCHDYYGQENGDLVISLLEKMTANSRNIRRICYGSAMNSAVMLPEALVRQARADLRRAIRDAPEGKRRTRIERFNDSMEVHFRIAELFRAYADALNYRSPDKIRIVRDQAVDFLGFWEARGVASLFSRRVLLIPELVLKQNFAAIEPVARPNAFHDEDILVKTIFSGDTVPETLANLFVLPERWKLKLDPRAVGVEEQWGAPELDDSEANGWQQVSSWNFIERQGYGDNRLIDGHFWYRVRFEAPVFREGANIFLRIGSLDDEGSVYLNGVQVADRHMTDGHRWDESFAVDVTTVIRPGEQNLLVVHGYDAEGAAGVWRPSALYTK